MLAYIESGKSDGAKIVTGGAQIGHNGYFVQPTIFADVRSDMKIVKEEIFGPVAVVIKFNTEEEVLEMANDTEYGLAALVFSENMSRALRVAHGLEAGQLCVSPKTRVSAPIGGLMVYFLASQGEHRSRKPGTTSVRWFQAIWVRQGVGPIRT